MARADDELERLRALGPPDDAWVPPPDGLWERIDAALGDQIDPAPAPAPAAASPDQRRRLPIGMLAAAAALVIAVAAGVVLVSRSSGDAGTVMARAELDPLAAGASGDARLVDDDGEMRLLVDVDGLAEIDGYYEVWLLDAEASSLISLGPMRGDGSYALPTGIDPAAFPVVDVSIEPFDGDPTHSTNSVLRGQLDLE